MATRNKDDDVDGINFIDFFLVTICKDWLLHTTKGDYIIPDLSHFEIEWTKYMYRVVQKIWDL